MMHLARTLLASALTAASEHAVAEQYVQVSERFETWVVKAENLMLPTDLTGTA